MVSIVIAFSGPGAREEASDLCAQEVLYGRGCVCVCSRGRVAWAPVASRRGNTAAIIKRCHDTFSALDKKESRLTIHSRWFQNTGFRALDMQEYNLSISTK